MILKFSKLIIFLLFFFNNSLILAESLSKKTIISGNDRISKETILVYSKIDEYNEINEEFFNNILKNLYDTNYFKDISISYKNDLINIFVIENPIIQNMKFIGIKSKSLKENVLKNITLKERSSFNDYSLEFDKKTISNNLRNLGYYFSQVDVLVESLSNNKVNVIYEINLGDKSKIKKITFLGNKIYKDNKLKNLIISEEYRFWKFISGKKYLNEDLINIDQRLLKNFYLNNGYFNVAINSSFAKLTSENEFELIFNIDAKDKIFFNELSIKLPEDFNQNNFLSLKKIFSKIKNTPYSIDKIKLILNEIDNITLNEEFVSIKASVNEQLVLDKINLVFEIEKIDKFYVDKINIFGNNITRENVIRNQFEIDEGDPYNEILFNKSINNLKALNFFREVDSSVRITENNNREIDIFLEEKATGEIMAGAGFGTSGATFIAGIKENNYLGKGISLNSNIEVNESSIKGSIGLSNPNIYNSDNSGYFSFEISETDKLSLYGYKTNKSGFSFGTGFEYLQDFDLNLGTSSYFEKIETDSTASSLRQSQKGNYWDTFLKIDFNYDKRNQKFQTSSGFRSYYSLDLPIISKTNTMINNYNFEIFKELYQENITSVSFSLGSANSITGENIKLSERIYIPSRKLRGFEIGKVGPKDGDDFIGGNYFSSINLSSTLPQILSNSQSTDFIIFFDAANLWGVDYNNNLDNNKIRSSIGIGLDWWTPVGPLSLTFSEALSKSETDIKESFRFNIGTTF